MENLLNCNLVAFYFGLFGFSVSILGFIAQHLMKDGSKESMKTSFTAEGTEVFKDKSFKFNIPFLCLLLICSVAITASPVIAQHFWKIDVCGDPIGTDQLRKLNEVHQLNQKCPEI